jgi:hypothetical protein
MYEQAGTVGAQPTYVRYVHTDGITPARSTSGRPFIGDAVAENFSVIKHAHVRKALETGKYFGEKLPVGTLAAWDLWLTDEDDQVSRRRDCRAQPYQRPPAVRSHPPSQRPWQRPVPEESHGGNEVEVGSVRNLAPPPWRRQVIRPSAAPPVPTPCEMCNELKSPQDTCTNCGYEP